MRELAQAELTALEARRDQLLADLKLLLVPKDPNDLKNVVLEIRAGAGGDEAALFASDLFRMYSRYAERQGWRVEVLNLSESGAGGTKEVTATIEGRGVYSRLKYESGVHRVQRVPATEASGRIHTSTATVAVLPEAEEVDIHIDPKDLRIDTFCSSGPGGQSVNTTYSAVRITHIPTNTVVSQQDEKSQVKNRAKAMKVLRSRLYEMEMRKQQEAIAKDRRTQVGTGDRSEKIRTYNFRENRITDHRIGFTMHQLTEALDGDLDDLIDAAVTHFTSEKLKEATENDSDGDADTGTTGLMSPLHERLADAREHAHPSRNSARRSRARCGSARPPRARLRPRHLPDSRPRSAPFRVRPALSTSWSSAGSPASRWHTSSATASSGDWTSRSRPACSFRVRKPSWSSRKRCRRLPREPLVRHIIDVGTGSGCLAVILAVEFASASVIAIDSSHDGA